MTAVEPAADTPLPALIELAWREYVREPARLASHGERIVALAPAGSAEEAWGWLLLARGQRFHGLSGPADEALQRAEALFRALGHEAGIASCDEQRAFILGSRQQWPEARALLEATARLPPALRAPWERLQGHQRRGWMYDRLGLRDQALRERYAALACARETADEGAIGYALALLAGQHADLYNLEEADRLGREAVQRAGAALAFSAWSLAALNHLNALVALQRGAEGKALVDQLLACEDRQSPAAREQRCIVYADVLLQCGAFAQAQELLDESVAHRHPGGRSLLSHTTVQLALHCALGRWGKARALGESWLASPDHGTDPAELPSELLRLLQLLSQACEHQGDPGAALRHQRRAFEVHDALVGRSARAHRQSLAIEHELDRERWQREQAERERSRAETERQRLGELNRALEAASAAKTRFLAAASHDLRQPVQALALNMAALQHEQVSPAQAPLVQRMGASLQALTQMFEVLMDISRLDAGTVPVALQPVSLPALLERLHAELQSAAAARGLQWRLRIAGAASAACTRSDPVLLERCLRNLLDNALKYTRSGGVLLALRVARGGWRLQVCDTGIGMTPQVLERAFDEFFQADHTESDRRRGLGLGLAIVQRLSTLLGHGLTLRSFAGRGTTASLQLASEAPTTAGASLLAGGQGVEHPNTAAGPWVGDRLRGQRAGTIAVVDDDDAVREALTALLQRWGHPVLQGADDGQLLEDWTAAGRPPVQALITDLRLRGRLDGLTVVQVLRKSLGHDLPALVITGDIAAERLQRLRESGLPWLAKPVMPMRLRGWLAALPDAKPST